MMATSDTVQSEPHSRTEYVKFEPSQHTVMEQTRRFSYRQSPINISKVYIILRATLLMNRKSFLYEYQV
jgi:UDP-N-acetylenolpyruvoylglucosamine reductase